MYVYIDDQWINFGLGFLFGMGMFCIYVSYKLRYIGKIFVKKYAKNVDDAVKIMKFFAMW